MKCYKGFDKNMQCRGFQFKEGETYELPEGQEAKLCENGFHACEMPLDVFNYYRPADSEYHEVELEDVSTERKGDSKVCGRRIKIGAKLSIKNIVDAQIEYVKERTHEVKGGRTHANYGAASATGNYGAASATGDQGAASATGDHGAASATGDQGAASATGDQGAASATGYHGAASATGYQGAASATGTQGAASATGNYGAASATGKGSIAIASGFQGKAKAALGCAICLCERGQWDGETFPLLAVKAAIVDGQNIKPDTWYVLINGEFVEKK